jgi:hypothetical protein
MKKLRVLKWVLIVYLGGWLALWAAQKLSGRERFPIPGWTKRTSELRVRPLSPGEALVARSAKVGYNLVFSADFPWFLPKRASIRCRYDNIAENRGLRVAKEGEEDLKVACQGAGAAALACERARWVFACSEDGILRIVGPGAMEIRKPHNP